MKKNGFIIFCAVFYSLSSFRNMHGIEPRYQIDQLGSPRDVQLLLNLMYWSYQRSHISVQIQDLLSSNLTMSSMLYQNYTHTRRNPSLPVPYPSAALDPQLLNKLQCSLAHYQQCRDTYLHCLYHTVEQPLENESIRKYIAFVRSGARLISLQVIANHVVFGLQDKIAEFFANLSSSAHQTVKNLYRSDIFYEEKKFFGDISASLMGYQALKSWALLDKAITTASDECMRTIFKQQELYDTLWKDIEQARATYYKLLFNRLLHDMIAADYPAENLRLIFDEHGIIPSDAPLQILSYLT